MSQYIGNKHVVDYFDKMLSQKSLYHAYLISGSRYLGKKTFVYDLAGKMFCESFDFCGQCQSCRMYVNKTYPDFYELTPEEGKSTITIKQVRDFSERIHQQAFLNKSKVAIIQKAHMLTAEASNALLKLLEEPPENTYIFLVTDQSSKILGTIRSRCIHFTFAPVAVEECVEYFSSVDADKVRAMHSWSNGRPGLIQRWIDDEDAYRSYLDVVGKISNATDLEDLLQEVSSKDLDEENIFESIEQGIHRRLLANNSRSKSVADYDEFMEGMNLIRNTNASKQLILENILFHIFL